MENPNWTFWGEEGSRFLVCKQDGSDNSYGYAHFRVVHNGINTHRLAVIREGGINISKEG
jgi:hypothetical protein